MKSNNFHYDVGDLVHIKPEMPEMMKHFTKDKDAIVVEYNHNKCQSGNGWEHEYSLYIKGAGKTSWYHNFNLDLIEKNRMDLLKEWKAAQKIEDDKHADIDWIFSHGKEVLCGASGHTLSTLGKHIGINNLWGAHGEGMSYYTNAHNILCAAEPFLLSGDKDGWLEFAKNNQIVGSDYVVNEGY